LQEASYIYDSNGKVLAKLTGDEDSSYLKYDQIPQNAVNAFVAIEDRTFWENPGIDIKGIFRVAVNYFLTEGAEKHGASTITQQLARNRFLTREVSMERKIKEMLISLDLTKKYTKEQIMEFYINDISFANTYYGLQAAARGYFGKDADELSLSQTAYLCAIPNSPTYYNPYRHPENALTRRDKILEDMLSMGFITEKACKEAKAEEITVNRQRVPLHNYETTYAIDCAIRYLMRRDGFEFQYGFLSFRLDSGKQKGKLDDQERFPEITIIEKLRGKRQMAKGNNTKAKIARVAWKLFHEKGYEETTIDEIILQSGTSKGSFYHYYSGKDELLASLPEIFDAKYEEVMQALDPEMDSFDKLMTLCFSVHDLIESDIPVGLLASLYSSQVVTKGDKHLLNQNRFYYKMVNQLVDEGQRRGQITRSMPYYEIAHMYAICERDIIYD